MDGRDDLLAEWRALSNSWRRRIRSAIAERLSADAPEAPPRVEIYAATREGERVTLHFIVDAYRYIHSIAGSDWAEHDVCTGRVLHAPDAPLEVERLEDRSVRLSERQAEEYRPDRVVDEVRAEKLAQIRGAEVERARAIVDARAREARRR
jgi:hypothetical protein